MIDSDTDTDDIRFYPIDDQYKEMLKYLHKLYDEGLIEESIYSLEVDQHLANAADDRYGAGQFYNPSEVYGEEVGGKVIPGNALDGADGAKRNTGNRSS